jgi:hypothetical protein
MGCLYSEVLAIPGHPDWGPAVEALKDTLRASGIGGQIQEDAICAYCAGDTRATSVGGAVKRWADGTELTTSPDGVHIVTRGRATGADLSQVPGQPPLDTRPASEVMSGMWDGVVHRGHVGIPGLGG